MIFNDITSTSNAKYKYIKSLLLKKSRQKNGEFTVEGIKSVNEAVEAQMKISAVAVSESFAETENFAYPENVTVYRFSDGMFAKMCDTENPQGILAVLKMRSPDEFDFEKDKMYIYCDGVSDPGNLGTIIRTADAVGAGGVIMSAGCADIYNPKTIRATMGSFFHIDICECVSCESIARLKSRGFKIVCGALSDKSVAHTECDMTGSVVIVLGNEANGVSEKMLNISDETVKIPIIGKAESLNVSVAGAVLMYESLRQRQNKV